MWDIKHKSGTLLFTTSDESVADNRRTMGWVVEMKKLTVEKAQELIEQLSQGERSCREEYYLQALEAFVGCQWIAWNGGECPVNEMERVQVKFLNGRTDVWHCPEIWDWTHTDNGSDVVAYRVVPL